MKKNSAIVCWIGVSVFVIMALYALSAGGLLGALVFLLGGAILVPLEPVKKIKGKLKLNIL